MNDSLVVWKEEDGTVSSAGKFIQGKLDGWLSLYRDGRLVIQGRDSDSELEGGVVFFYNDGKPMMWVRPAADKQHVILSTYYPGSGSILFSAIHNANGEGDPVMSAWDKQGKPTELPAVRADLEAVQAAMTDLASEIQRITVERVQVELDKMLLGAQPWLGIDLMVTTGLADYVFPELPRLQLAQDEHHQHKDVYAHSLQVLRQAMDQEAAGEPDLVLRWAALVHDIGKPDTREFTEDGRVSFHQHEVVGAKLVRNRMRKLKYSKAMVRDVSQLVYLHMRFHGFSEGQWTDSAVRRYVTDAGDLLPRLHKLVRADCTTRNKRKAAWLRQMYAQLEERIADLAAKEDLAKVRPDLDGKEIMAILGLQPGPDVGEAWSYLKEVRLERGPLDRDEAIKVLTTWWADRQGQQEQQDQQIHQVQQDER